MSSNGVRKPLATYLQVLPLLCVWVPITQSCPCPLQSIGMFTLASVGLAALVVVLGLLFLLFRFGICYKSGGTCGKRWPTQVTRKRCKCGYVTVWQLVQVAVD